MAPLCIALPRALVSISQNLSFSPSPGSFVFVPTLFLVFVRHTQGSTNKEYVYTSVYLEKGYRFVNFSFFSVFNIENTGVGQNENSRSSSSLDLPNDFIKSLLVVPEQLANLLAPTDHVIFKPTTTEYSSPEGRREREREERVSVAGSIQYSITLPIYRYNEGEEILDVAAVVRGESIFQGFGMEIFFNTSSKKA